MELPKPTGNKNERGEDIYVTDAMIDQLLAPDRLGQALKASEQKQKQLSKEQIHLLRVQCKRDLFFLCSGVLGYNRLTVSFHGHLCEAHRRSQYTHRFREWLLARGNFKSTIITIGGTIQDVLPYTAEDARYDDDPLPIVWPYNLGTNIRALICHETQEGAARFLYPITNHFVANPLLMALFPECVPHPRKNRMNKFELELPRTIVGAPEPTIDTMGVGGKSQGRHYNKIRLDDIYGDKARDSEAESATTKEWFDNIQAFFSDFAKDRIDIVGTRYSEDDLYAHIHDAYGSALFKYIRKLEEVDPKTGETYVTFPEGFPPETLTIIKKNKRVYNAQYLNDPDSLTSGWDQNWMKFFQWETPNTLSITDVTGRKELINVRDLDIVILIDPGKEKSGGFVVSGMDYRRRIFTLLAIPMELRPPELTNLSFTQVIRWQPRTLAIESDFFMDVFQFWWRREMQIRNVHFHISPVYTKQKSKEDRIDGLSNYFASGQIFFNRSQTELIEEFKRWRKSKNIHILDALAYGPELWRPGWAPGTRQQAHTEGQTDDRDVQTGYSAI